MRPFVRHQGDQRRIEVREVFSPLFRGGYEGPERRDIGVEEPRRDGSLDTGFLDADDFWRVGEGFEDFRYFK
jgi:hypothetical protein